MNWQPGDVIVYRVPGDSAWHYGGTLAQLEAQHEQECREGELRWLFQEAAQWAAVAGQPAGESAWSMN